MVDPTIPGTQGWDLCRRLLEEGSLPVIVFGGRSSDAEQIVTLELGADDYIGSGLSPREVVARIKVILRRYAETDCSDAVASES